MKEQKNIKCGKFTGKCGKFSGNENKEAKLIHLKECKEQLLLKIKEIDEAIAKLEK